MSPNFFTAEYIWVDGSGKFRSKSRVCNNNDFENLTLKELWKLSFSNTEIVNNLDKLKNQFENASEDIRLRFEDKVKKYSRSDPYYDFIKIDPKTTKAKRIIAFNKFRAEIVQKHLGIDAQKVKFLRHEDCHKYYGIYSSPKLIKNSLVFTCEGGGDDSSATVSVFWFILSIINLAAFSP